MKTITITTPPQQSIPTEDLQNLLQGDVHIHEIRVRKENLDFDRTATHTHIHLVAHPFGLSREEIKTIEPHFSFRFTSAEYVLNAHTVFSQSFVGICNKAIHIFVSQQKEAIAHIPSLIKQIPSLETTENQTPPTSETTAPPPTHSGITLTQNTAEKPSVESQPSGWEETLTLLGGNIQPDSWVPVNITKPPPVRNILEGTSSRKKVVFNDGREYVLYGYPNFEHRNAKVLLVGIQGSFIEVIALHRAPQKTGIFSQFGLDWLPTPNDAQEFCKEHTGRVAPRSAITLFAIDTKSVYYLHQKTVYQWDGKKERDYGLPNQALSSLILSWSQQ